MVDQALKKIPKELFKDIFVSDDCSTDKTAEIYTSKGYKVFKNDKNRGYGGNVKSSFLMQF